MIANSGVVIDINRMGTVNMRRSIPETVAVQTEFIISHGLLGHVIWSALQMHAVTAVTTKESSVYIDLVHDRTDRW